MSDDLEEEKEEGEIDFPGGDSKKAAAILLDDEEPDTFEDDINGASEEDPGSDLAFDDGEDTEGFSAYSGDEEEDLSLQF